MGGPVRARGNAAGVPSILKTADVAKRGKLIAGHATSSSIQVTDDGRGPGTRKGPSGHGLVGMKERAAVCGGSVGRELGGDGLMLQTMHQVLKDGRPWLALGSPGGATIITTVLQVDPAHHESKKRLLELYTRIGYGNEAADLSALLRGIQSAKTPIERFKLAARSWRTVRALPRVVFATPLHFMGGKFNGDLEPMMDADEDGRDQRDFLRTITETVPAGAAVSYNTGQPGIEGRGWARAGGRILSGFVCALGYLWILWDPNKQGLHDKVASTVVIRM